MKKENIVTQRLRKFIESKNLSIREFERSISVANATIANAIKNNTSIRSDILYKIFYKYPELNPNYLFGRSDEMIQLSVEQKPGKLSGNSIPLLPTYAIAGESLFSEVISHNNIEDYLRIPNVRADFAVPVSGESMHPYYRAGDIIACKIIKDASFFQWGRVYLLNTRQGLMLKRIYPGSNGNVRCVSYNSDYPPFELPQEDILSVAVVVALVRIE
ncbi:MAG: hypothetical protein KatS3mg033_1919 [Thermonema sp.]|nr:MAG: hypothetical protein KatS3mg033_1919 [Thermonema sp.]